MERTPEAYARGILAALLEPWIAGLEQISTTYATDDRFRGELDDPAIEAKAKLALLDGVLPSKMPHEVHNFLGVLLANGDFGLVDDVLAVLTRLFAAEGGPQRALVTSAIPLGSAEQERMRTHIIEQFGSNLSFEFHVDPGILGGVVVQVGDKLIDDSVRGRLEALRNTLGVRAA